MKNKKESNFMIFSSVVVLSTSIISPFVSVVILLGIVIAFAIYKSKLPKDKI